ncbi:sulfotransferase family protein [Bythopirellula goksoeyrii]|uniref:Sulfotransferase domain protein n=1 Tax=Bythopirellula goksoeyrii TaxID=1400387 RepID=A0A5B9Q833_9BACT|nr:sulfotransferase [Bythopirellula goksoeyrii]QEG33036.1 Sulfotransferase domain protein [Bythopirellula goksoeyrii]
MSVLEERVATPRRKRVVKNPVPWYTPRFWHGMRFSTWVRTLAHNQFDVSFTKLHTATSITFISGLNSLLATLDRLFYSRKVEQVELAQPPIFILGHWRAGTTFLHELLICDPTHTYPNTYQCFVPHHFVLTEKWLAPLTSKLIPSRRPMDNMAAGWQRPQEDEFALCNLGVPTPYLSMLFPKRGEAYPEYLDLQSLEQSQRRAWGNALHHFFKRVTLRDSRRIVVKSPPHTARVRTLCELYPKAKFVHIVRDPYDLFVSTMGLWKSLNEVQRMQGLGDQDWVEEYVLGSLDRMYAAYEVDRKQLAQNQIVELRYEDLVQDPLNCVRQLYADLELGDFSRVEPAIKEHLAAVKNYHPNHYELGDEKREMIRQRWASYFENYGY